MMVIKQKADHIGAFSSALCLIHCVATPFIFVAQSSAFTLAKEAPSWWKFIDYIFLIISFLAIYNTVQNTSKYWIKPALYMSWFLLFVVIINEKISWFALPESAIYLPAVLLIGLHLYNRKYCKCNTDKCCTHER